MGTLPVCWSEGELTFLTKPGKKGHRPDELRPIALLEPSGKCALGMFSSHLFPQISSRLFRLPQFAYLHGRGTDDAIQRVRDHCQQVRTLLDTHKYHVHAMATDNTMADVMGGLMLSLDLSKAFDSVSRPRLIEALHRLGVDINLIHFLVNIYRETSFSFSHRGHQRTFKTQQGIRQGCKSAPILWACFAAVILENTATATSRDWMLQSITAFADDFCLHCLCMCAQDVKKSLAHIGRFLDILTEAGLTINMNKTVVVFKIKGPRINPITKQYIRRTKDGVYLCIPCRQGPVHIRLVSHFSYLGVVMSYSNFMLLTARHRIKAGVKVTHQLSRWLHRKIGLSKYQKLRLWFQCTFPCIIYGLRVTGLDIPILKLIDQTFMQQIRRIFHEPVFSTRTSHAQFLADHCIPDPLDRFLQQCCQAAERETLRLSSLAPDDILHYSPITDLNHINQVFAEVHRQRRDPSGDPEADLKDFSCHLCNEMFATMAALRRHWTNEHERRTGQLRSFHMTDSYMGLPTCARCDMQFTTWHSFHYHVKFVCHMPQQEEEDLEHRLRVREFLHFIRGMSFVELGHNRTLTTYFLNRCIICGKYVLSVKGMLSHWGRDHVDLYRQHGPWNDFLHKRTALNSPCMLCGTSFQRMHHCLIIRQYAMQMCASGQHLPRDQGMPQETFPCQQCSKVFVTRHGLQQHLRRFHAAMQAGQVLTDDQFDAHCLITQAVETASCPSLLENADIVELMSQTCLLCQTSFGRKGELVRHIRQHHALLWQQGESEAIRLDDTLKLATQCYCIPAVPHRKHLCLPFIQFTLLGIQLTAAPDAPAAVDAPPDLLLSTREVVQQLAWLGLLHVLVLRPRLRLSLTLHCQLCEARFASSNLLLAHLWINTPQR